MSDRDNLLPLGSQDVEHSSGCLALSTARPNCADRDYRFRGLNHCLAGPKKNEIRTVCVCYCRPLHDILMWKIAVCENDLIDLVLVDQFAEFFFRNYRNAIWIESACEFRRILFSIDSRYLRRRESYYFELFVVSVVSVEVMKVSSGSAENQNLFSFQFLHLHIYSNYPLKFYI